MFTLGTRATGRVQSVPEDVLPEVGKVYEVTVHLGEEITDFTYVAELFITEFHNKYPLFNMTWLELQPLKVTFQFTPTPATLAVAPTSLFLFTAIIAGVIGLLGLAGITSITGTDINLILPDWFWYAVAAGVGLVLLFVVYKLSGSGGGKDSKIIVVKD